MTIQVIYKGESEVYVNGLLLSKNKALSFEKEEFDKFMANPYIKSLQANNFIKVFGDIDTEVKKVVKELKEEKKEKEVVEVETKENVEEEKETPKKKKGKK